MVKMQHIFQYLITCHEWMILQKCLLIIIISMQNFNHIIIPIVKRQPTHEELNVFQASQLCLTSQKDAPIFRALTDRKCGSAFKKYKLKKEKKEENCEAGKQQQYDHGVKISSMPLKIKIINVATETINKSIFHIYNLIPQTVFYDPNQAPLYVPGCDEQYDQIKQQQKTAIKPLKIEEQPEIQVQQKIKIEPQDQELQQKYVQVAFIYDDPFIILKKTSVKKKKLSRNDSNLVKTKLIKKVFTNNQKKTIIEAKINEGSSKDIKKSVIQFDETQKKQSKFNFCTPQFQSLRGQQNFKNISSMNLYISQLPQTSCQSKCNQENNKLSFSCFVIANDLSR